MATANANSADADAPTPNISIPNDLTSSTAKLVYLYVHSAGQTTITELRDSLNMKSMTVLGVLSILISRGYITRDGDSLSAQDL